MERSDDRLKDVHTYIDRNKYSKSYKLSISKERQSLFAKYGLLLAHDGRSMYVECIE